VCVCVWKKPQIGTASATSNRTEEGTFPNVLQRLS
jgi:hypothetical protein